MKSESRRGFTLIELLTVIAIIGILAGMLFPAINAVRRKSKIATSQSTFSQWCTAVNRYKSVYGFYPNIGTKYDPSVDSVHKLEDVTTTQKFIKALSGKNPSGLALDTTTRASLNRNAEEFCAFSKEDYAYYSTNIDSANTFLVDKFGNYLIRVIFDTDSTGNIKKISGVTIPDDINSAKNESKLGIDSTTVGIPARVIIFTAAAEAKSFDGTATTSLTGDDAADIIAIQ
jgi:prepilin-type N-terminal cleavage/methylation domain-containing protein